MNPIKVFVSWAHSGEDWDSDQSRAWERRVIAFTTILRSLGIDADVDLYHGSDPSIDWTRFGQSSVKAADFVIVVHSKAWGERWSGLNSPSVGTGAVVEADTLKGLLQENQAEFQEKVLLVRLPGPGKARIPADLNRLNRFTIDPEESDSFNSLIRTLTDQPAYQIPTLGQVPVLPATLVEEMDLKTQEKSADNVSDYEAIRDEIDKVNGEKNGSSSADEKRRLSTLMGLLDALRL